MAATIQSGNGYLVKSTENLLELAYLDTLSRGGESEPEYDRFSMLFPQPSRSVNLGTRVDGLVPESQCRSLFREAFAGQILRDHLGLKPPANLLAPTARAAAE